MKNTFKKIDIKLFRESAEETYLVWIAKRE